MLPFRTSYVSHDEITRTVHAWAAAHPDFVRVESIGTSTEGRDLWLLTIGRDPSRARPAAWVDGNMHAPELCGSSVALGIAEEVIRLHADPSYAPFDLPAHVRERLREILFYVLPRMCPDGAEAVLREGRYVRSNPRDHRIHAPVPRWILGDVNGDGAVLLMRKKDETGEYVASEGAPGLMVPRRLEDEGPFYKLFPEGTIAHWDGSTIPSPSYLSDTETDLNRNFPDGWAPEHQEAGAGRFPLSEPESRAVVEFVTARPHIFSWLNLHTFGGVYIRPLGDAPDNKMDPGDLSVFLQVAEWGEKHGGYPTVSGFEEFTYEPERPLHGDLVAFAYNQRGAIAYVCELWDLFKVLGKERPKRFVDHYTHLTGDDMRGFHAWDREHNQGRIFRPFVPFTHPQLGEVEVGGIDRRVGLANPPIEQIDEVCRKQAAAYLRVAAMAPALRLRVLGTVALGGGVTRVDLGVENHGYLPTYVLSSARKLAMDARVFVEARGEGCEIVSEAEKRIEVGHLEGWGRGPYDGSVVILTSKGSTGKKRASVTVRGKGVLVVRASGMRVGAQEIRVEV